LCDDKRAYVKAYERAPRPCIQWIISCNTNCFVVPVPFMCSSMARHMFATCVIATGVLSFEISFFYVYVVWYVESSINNMVVAFVDKLPVLASNHSITSECVSQMLHMSVEFAAHDNEMLLIYQGQSTILSIVIISIMLLICTLWLNRHTTSMSMIVAEEENLELEAAASGVIPIPTRPRRHTEHDGSGPWSPPVKNNYVQ